MSDDVADRAELLLWADTQKFIPESSGPLVALVPELVAELKTTRARLEAEKAVCADISELLVKVGLYATKGNSGPENRAVILRGFGPGANEGP